MRLQVRAGKDPPDLRGRDPQLGQVFGQQPVGPGGVRAWRHRGRRRDHLQPLPGVEPGTAQRAGPFGQRRRPLGGEPFPPGTDRVHVSIQRPGDGRVGHTVGCGQERSGSGDPPGRRGPGHRQLRQLGALPRIEHDNERTRQRHGPPRAENQHDDPLIIHQDWPGAGKARPQ